jgi:hypothetical protein
MDNVVKSMLSLFLIIVFIFTGVSLIVGSVDAKNADTYLEESVNAISASDFSENTINTLEQNAKAYGYVLTVEPQSTHNDGKYDVAKVTLKYKFRLPIFGVDADRYQTDWAK